MSAKVEFDPELYQPQPSAGPLVLSPPSLTQHIYGSLLDGQDSDFQVCCFGQVYRLHRLVLNQVDFFRGLLQGSWRETNGDFTSTKPIPITFPGQVHRAAFECCLSRIYGGGPRIVPPPWAWTSNNPFLLGRTYALLQHASQQAPQYESIGAATQDEQAAWSFLLADQDSQPAPPSFLLSLLVCADYLRMVDLVNETVELILRTITPFTVVRYLEFTMGDLSTDDLAETDKHMGCRSLESLAHRNSTDEIPNQHGDSMKMCSQLYNGGPAQKIGRVCANWLSRWASDLIGLEEALSGLDEEVIMPPSSDETALRIRWASVQRPPMRLWRRGGGLTSKWVRVLISSNALFLSQKIFGPDGVDCVGVSDEWRRYGLARRVWKIREREGLADALDAPETTPAAPPSVFVPDAELVQMFEDGIYYSHLNFQQLSFISEDRSTITRERFVTSARLRQAHWLASDFQTKLLLGSSLTCKLDQLDADHLPVYVLSDPISESFDLTEASSTLVDTAFFGLGRNIVRERLDPTLDKNLQLTVYEPIRFSTEFFDLVKLRKEIVTTVQLMEKTTANEPTQIYRSYGAFKVQAYLQRSSQRFYFIVSYTTLADGPQDRDWKDKLNQPHFSIRVTTMDGQGGRLAGGKGYHLAHERRGRACAMMDQLEKYLKISIGPQEILDKSSPSDKTPGNLFTFRATVVIGLV